MGMLFLEFFMGKKREILCVFVSNYNKLGEAFNKVQVCCKIGLFQKHLQLFTTNQSFMLDCFSSIVA
jgi:hypothetical protein